MQLAPKAVRIEGGEGGTQVYPVLRRGREYCLGARGCCLLVDGLLSSEVFIVLFYQHLELFGPFTSQ